MEGPLGAAFSPGNTLAAAAIPEVPGLVHRASALGRSFLMGLQGCSSSLHTPSRDSSPGDVESRQVTMRVLVSGHTKHLHLVAQLHQGL